MADKKITSVYQTDDYSKFKLVDGNRPIDHAKKIIESIKEIGMLWQPILVNERFEIIDGQGRFLAMKTLKLPIIYIRQDGLTIKEVRYLNQNATIWKAKDYIHSYAVGSDSRSSYTNFEVVQRQFPEFGEKIIMKAGGDHGLATNQTSILKNGTYDGMDFEHMNTAIRRLTILKRFDAIIPKNVLNRTNILFAIIFCIYISEVDANFSILQLEDAVKKNIGAISCSKSLRDAIHNVNYMYNWKRTGKNRYNIERKYEDICFEIKSRTGKKNAFALRTQK